MKLFWVEHNIDKLGVTYHDVQGSQYDRVCDEDHTVPKKKGIFPEWNESEILKIWQHEQRIRDRDIGNLARTISQA